LEARHLLAAAIEPPAGLVGWWSGDGNASDIAGLNDGVMHNGVSFESGHVGQAFRLDGVDDWISTNQAFANDQSHTIEAWVNWGGDNGQRFQEIASWWNQTDPVANRMFLGTRSGGNLRYGDAWNNVPASLATDQWVHLAATYDNTTNDRQIFLNGTHVASLSGTAEARFSDTLAIGRQGNAITAGEYWNGLVDELSLYDRPLSAAEIQSIFDAGSAGKVKLYGDFTVTSLSVSADLVEYGETFTLAAESINLSSGTVQSVAFYHDTDGNQSFDPATDQLLSTDSTGSDGWTADVVNSEFPPGTQSFFAQAENDAGQLSNHVTVATELIAPVRWDGDAGDFDWNNPLNWNTDALPTASDDVIIEVAGDVTIEHHSGTTQIASLQSSESLNLNGGSLTVTEPSVVSGPLMVAAGATLVANGPNASLEAIGATEIDGANLHAISGGAISMPTLTSYQSVGSATIIASGMGTQIDLSAVEQLIGPTNQNSTLNVIAEDGGSVSIPDAITLSNRVNSIARGPGSLIDYALASQLQTSDVALGANAATVMRFEAADGGAINTPSITSLQAVSLVAAGGSQINMPTATSYDAGDRLRSIIQATGSDSSIDLSGLTSFAGATGNWYGPVFTTVQALNGGSIDLSNAAKISRQTDLHASGAGSLIDLTGTTTLQGGPGLPDRPYPFALRLRVDDGGTIHTPNVETLEATSLIASTGSDIVMPTATSYLGGDRLRNLIQATGSNSSIDLSGLTSFAGGSGSWYGDVRVSVQSRGGSIDLGHIEDLSDSVDFLAVDNGSIRITTREASITGSVSLTAVTGSIIAESLRFADSSNVKAEGLLNADIANEGELSIGSGIGSLSIVGSFSQRSSGELNLQLGGGAVGQYDSIATSGVASLDGTLNVSFANGFAPGDGQAFEIISFDSRVCDFQTKTGLELGDGLYLAAAFDANSMTLGAGTTPDSGQQCQTIPAFTNQSVGPNPAKAGDDLSITFEVDVPLADAPDVTVDGNAVTQYTQNGSIYSFSYNVSGNETEGDVDVEIVAESLDGGIGTSVLTTELDFTPPVVTSISPQQDPADVGSLLTITFDSSEPLSPGTEVTIGGQPATRDAGPGYSYSRVLTGDEGLGQVTVEVAAVDLAGNTSTTSGQANIVSGGLDVNVNGIDLSSDRTSVGQRVTATAEIYNSGLYDIHNVPVRLSIFEPGTGEKVLQTITVPVIAAGATATVSTPIDLATDGVHVFKLQVDPDDVIEEITELDNVATRSLIVDSSAENVVDVTAALSQASVAAGGVLSLTGTASWLSNLSAAGAVAGGQVTLTIAGTNVAAEGFTDSNGDFAFDFTAPVTPGNYLANVTISDVTTETLVVLPLAVTAPAGGVDLLTRNELLAVSDSTPIVDTPVTISARIYNVGGDDFSGTAAVRFYDGSTLISTQSVTDLNAQSFADVSFSHTFDTVGNHNLKAVVDEDQLVIETSEQNNSGSISLNVLNTVANLSPVDVLFSDTTPATTDDVALTAKVVNNGGASASDVVVRFFDEGNPLGAAVIPSLAADGGFEFATIQTTLAAAGTRQIQVVVDPDNAVIETDEEDNVRSETIDVHLPAPDLTASLISLSNNTPVVGDSVEIAMTVGNQGELNAAAFDVEFSKDGTAFGTVRIPGLEAGTETVVTLPASFENIGQHTVSLVVDAGSEIAEISEFNNQSSRQLEVLATPLPDLQIVGSDFTLSNTNPQAGESVTVSIPVANVGGAAARDVSAQLQIDGHTIGNATTVPADIDPGQSGDWTFTFDAPVGDGFHLLEVVVDETNQIGESNENNNRDFIQFLVGDHPDLVPFDITFSDSTPLEGDLVTVSATVKNQGDDVADEFVTRVFDGSQQIGQVTVPGLAAGAQQIISIPFDTTGRTGDRLIQVVADPANVITEINEGNNLVSRILPINSADAIAPTTTADASVPANEAGWNNTDVEITLTATDNDGGSGVAALRYSLNGEPYQTFFSETQTLSLSSEGIHTIAYQAVDFAQNTEALKTLTVRIDKTAPAVVHDGPFTVNEGSTVSLTGAASTDSLSGIATTAWELNGDGAFDDGDPATFAGLDGPATHEVFLRATDVAGNLAEVTTQVQVDNVAPTLEAGSNEVLSAQQEGIFSRTSIEFADPGADAWTGTVDYGDGSGEQSLNIDAAKQTFDLGHTYTAEGTFTVTVTLQDDDLASATDTFTVDVTLNSPPQANDAQQTTNEDVDAVIDLRDHVDDAESLPGDLTYQIESVTHGILEPSVTAGLYTFRPSEHFSGVAEIEYSVSDPGGLVSSTATVEVTVNAVADPPTTSLSGTTVPADAVQWKVGDGGNGHFYWLSEARGTWYEAQSEALSAGGHLVSIHSQAEQDFLEQGFLSPTIRYWVGLTDANDQGTTEGNFVWSSGEAVTYTNWADGEPNNLNDEDWTLIQGQSDGAWNDGRFNSLTEERGIIEVAAAVSPALGPEDSSISLSFTASLVDTDGSESLSLAIAGLPAGAVLQDGTHSSTDPTVDITGWNLANLSVTPPANSDADFTLTVTATSTEAANGDTAENQQALDVTVTAVADQPTLTVSPASGNEDTAIPLAIGSALSDTDGSESLSLAIAGLPAGAVLQDGTHSSTDSTVDITGWDLANLSVTPPANSDADFTLTVTATSTEAANGDTALVQQAIDVSVLNIVDLAGYVFDDLNNDGSFDPAGGDTALEGHKLLLQADGRTVAEATTGSDGRYAFDFSALSLEPGTYTIRQESQPANYLDGRESIGNLDDTASDNGTVINNADSDAITDIVIGPAGSQRDTDGYDFAELRPASLQGLVWEDFNNEGDVDMGELAIEAVTIELTGTDDRGNPVSASQLTNAHGIYEFIDLRPGVYSLREIQPEGFADGQESLGEVLEPASAPLSGQDGIVDPAGDRFSGVELVAGAFGVNYNFGEQFDGAEVAAGQTATIGFWQNKKGQSLIRSLNGSQQSTLLADWLSDNFPNMYGDLPDLDSDGDVDNLDVADTYKRLFKRNGRTSPGGPPKLDAQVLAVAIASFATKQSLVGLIYDHTSSPNFRFIDVNGDGVFNLADGDQALQDSGLISQIESYGFDVTAGGLGSAKFNVGDGGEAFGVQDDEELRVIDLLLAADARAHDGLLYDIDEDGQIDNGEETLRVLANDVFSAVNEQGDI
jgi:subtilase family serine protease